MGPQPINNSVSQETIKSKRGRKSKKELMASLNIKSMLDSEVPISLHVSEKIDTENKNNFFTEIFQKVLNDTDFTPHFINDNENENENEIENENENENKNKNYNENDNDNYNDNYNENEIENIINNTDILPGSGSGSGSGSINEEQKPPIKKRGRKPKGGKIIQQISAISSQKEDKPNVILHLKCSMKDLLNNSNNGNYLVESYNLSKNDLSYDVITNENINNINYYNNNDKSSSSIQNLENDFDEEDGYCKDSNKEIWKKLKQLEHNLHINNVVNKRSACFWDTCEFDNPPIYIPKYFINGTYHVYGCFCSPECAVAYLMNENIDSSIKFERYHLHNHIYTKIYDYKKNIKPAPNPYYMLEKFYGNLSIQEYRSLLRNERLFLIVDKPLTRILPELHEDNDDFILNNKIIPSNNYNIKTRLQRKKQNKSTILNEKFGIANQAILE